MKKVILLGLLITLISCKQEESVRILTPKQAIVEAAQKKINADKRVIDFYDVYEIDYKGHTYICNNVHSGIGMTHAGHCKCNPNR